MFKLIQPIFFSLLLAVLGCALLAGVGVPPGWAWGLSLGGVVGLWGYGIGKAVQQDREIERLRVAAVRARREADAAQAIADRLGEEARQRMETRAAIQSLMNPN
jgi:hypothetical protein